MKISEKELAQQVAKYIQAQYPGVIFRYDAAADLRMTIGQAQRLKSLHGKRNRGYPDLFIAKVKGRYGGLFVELKVDSPYKKDGKLKKSKHLEEQANLHVELIAAGYRVVFAVGFDEAKEYIDNYIKRGI